MHKKPFNIILWLARIIAILWAGFWTFFGIASGLGEGLTPAGVFIHTLMPGLIFLLFMLLPWIWELGGGILLIVTGLFVCVAYPLMVHGRFPLETVIFVLLTMAIPPLVSGIMFVVISRKRKQ
jgi:hypothetical protein